MHRVAPWKVWPLAAATLLAACGEAQLAAPRRDPDPIEARNLIVAELINTAPRAGMFRNDPSQAGLCWNITTVEVVDQRRTSEEGEDLEIEVMADAVFNAILPFDDRCRRFTTPEPIQELAHQPAGTALHVPVAATMRKWESGWRVVRARPDFENAR